MRLLDLFEASQRHNVTLSPVFIIGLPAICRQIGVGLLLFLVNIWSVEWMSAGRCNMV